MTEYLNPRFSVHLGASKTYRDNWDAIFGKDGLGGKQEFAPGTEPAPSASAPHPSAVHPDGVDEPEAAASEASKSTSG